MLNPPPAYPRATTVVVPRARVALLSLAATARVVAVVVVAVRRPVVRVSPIPTTARAAILRPVARVPRLVRAVVVRVALRVARAVAVAVAVAVVVVVIPRFALRDAVRRCAAKPRRLDARAR